MVKNVEFVPQKEMMITSAFDGNINMWPINWLALTVTKAEHLYSALHGIQTTLKRSGMDHTVLPAINTMPAVYLVSVHQMAPPPIEVANEHLIAAHY